MNDRWHGSVDHPFWKVIAGEEPPAPASALLNWTVREAQIGTGRAVSEFEVSDAFVNPIGGVQGGFLTAMLDDSMGTALVTVLEADEVAPTLEIKTSFLRPARPGRFVGEGKVVHRGRSVAFVEATLIDVEGRPVAMATATTAVMRSTS